MNLLIVDDSITVRMMLKKIVSVAELPFERVFEAINGQEALDLLKKEDIAVAFVDINMPVMDGAELLENISKDESLKDVKPIVITPQGSEEKIQKYWELGARGFIQKPFTPESVKKEVERALKNE